MVEKKGDEIYVISEWGCLSSVLEEYGIDVHHISGKVGQHIVDDFMDAMVMAGHIVKAEENQCGK